MNYNSVATILGICIIIIGLLSTYYEYARVFASVIVIILGIYISTLGLSSDNL